MIQKEIISRIAQDKMKPNSKQKLSGYSIISLGNSKMLLTTYRGASPCGCETSTIGEKNLFPLK